MNAAPFTVTYDGDAKPDSATYGSIFTTIVFSGTSWSSDGDILTMNTAPSRGIWFGRGLGTPDAASFNLASSALGNRVEARVALGAGSTEWSLYWHDSDGYGSSFVFHSNGYTYQTAAGTTFVAHNGMTSFHTFTSHVHNGQVAYYVDGALVGSGNAVAPGGTNYLVFGDGSGSTPTGTGSFLVDYLKINVEAGALPTSVPDAGSSAALIGAALGGMLLVRRSVRAPLSR